MHIAGGESTETTFNSQFHAQWYKNLNVSGPTIVWEQSLLKYYSISDL